MNREEQLEAVWMIRILVANSRHLSTNEHAYTFTKERKAEESVSLKYCDRYVKKHSERRQP